MREDKMLEPIFNQLNIAIKSLIQLCDQFTEEELSIRPIVNKRSLGEILSHIAVICKADYWIANGATEVVMAEFYSNNEPVTIHDIREALPTNYDFLVRNYSNYSQQELHEVTISYWGVSYSRYEWLLEILCHVYHHRGQLYSLLTQNIREPKIILFD
ncbi:putative damage-inducible protein DinB [Paenibacillus sp. DS2015]|uniref:DinB family protein n=1 Tax=Paenibacillus sp. DS2015 TaxID=3373917 RepID=UPI003D214486